MRRTRERALSAPTAAASRPIRPIRQIAKPRFERYVLEDYEFHYGIEFREDAIVSNCLPKGTQIEQWEANLAFDPFA